MKRLNCLAFLFYWFSSVSALQRGTTRFPASSLNLPQTEIDALQSLYYSTDGLNWAWRGNSVRWNFSGNPNPCSEGWYGITCSTVPINGNLHVIQLSLSSWNLTGPLTEQLGQLQLLALLYLSDNRLLGTMPPELGNLTMLHTLHLYNNHLTGTLPSQLGSLTHLKFLYLYNNYLTGKVPPELGNLTLLEGLLLSNNDMTGTLPHALGSLTQLTALNLHSNYLTGTLPPELGNLTRMNLLLLFNNYLTGTLPPDLTSLTQLWELLLYTNHLTGTLPPELSSLTQLEELDLDTNHLTGTLPPELGNLTHLQVLYLYSNYLTGTLPPELGSLKDLMYLALDTNQLTGTLPPELGSLQHLYNLYLNTNGLTGTMPPELKNLIILQGLYLDTNDLTGNLRPELCNLRELQVLNLSTNVFTGTLPLALGNLTQLQQLFLDNNLMSGTLSPNVQSVMMPNLAVVSLGHNSLSGIFPGSWVQFSELQYISVSNNWLTGTLSNDLGSAKELVYLSVSHNHLSGCLHRLGATLEQLDVSYNHLRCSLDGVFDGAGHGSSLLNVQLEYNRFTGTLPAVVFSLPELQTLVAGSNCFTGTLPQEICQATALQSLILDGVGASRSCPTVWTTWQREGQLRIPNRFHGTIPECVFSLPELTSLHLSGNNLIGTIPDSVILGGNLTQLYLSHNLLTGSIPEAVQTHAWSQLDLSYNRFSGSLLPSFGEGTVQGPFNATASMVVNNSRLSGEIPATVLQLPQVSMLGTNMFSCKADKSDVPNTDGNGDKQRYQCGSDSFNYAFYLFLGLSGVAACILLVMIYSSSPKHGLSIPAQKWCLPQSSLPNSCQSVFAVITMLCKLAVYCCVPLLLVLVPWYSAASHYYGTYTHQYAWVVSAAFLSGLVPGLVEFFLWTTLIAVMAWLGYNFTSARLRSAAMVEDRNNATDSSHTWGVRAQAYCLFLGVNLVVVIGVNVAFVYVSLNERSEVVLLAQVTLSSFKFGWNTIGVPYLLEWISRRLMSVKGSSGFFLLQTFVGLFNNIAIPCLVVAAQSPSCFRDVLIRPADVLSDFAVQSCQVLSNEFNFTIDCSDPSLYPQQSSFTPQFIYSYECSSSFVTYYSAAMVYLALTAAVLVPAVRLLLCWVVRHTAPETRMYQWSNAALPKLWRVPVNAANPGVHTRQIDVDNLLVNMTVYLGIMLSFGVVFPPVALAMCVAMLSTAYQTRLAVGRLLCNAREVGAQHVVEAVEQDCRGVASLEKLQSMIVMAIVFACYFYALFIFDTIGDAEGLPGACWVLALWMVVPLCATAYIRYRQCGRSAAPTRLNASLSMDEPSVELVQIQGQERVGRAAAVGVSGMEEGGRRAGASVGEEETVSALHT